MHLQQSKVCAKKKNLGSANMLQIPVKWMSIKGLPLWQSNPPEGFDVASLTAKQWEINPFQLPHFNPHSSLLYLARLSHPLIVCGWPSAACKKLLLLSAPLRAPPGVMFHTWGRWLPKQLHLERSSSFILSLTMPFLFSANAACVQFKVPASDTF